MHMKKFIIIFVSLVLLNGCQRHAITKTHGISYLEKREKLIVEFESNKNDAIKALGYPNTRGMTNESVWIYVERTKKRGKLLKLGRDYLTKNNILVLEFDDFGMLNKKEFFRKEDMKKITFARDETANEIKKENFIYSFLSSIRQKMDTKKK
jgi:outer membrane protein assembly factor BamE (lipoprotein component of BamABCDE complex)